jgi:hypothetical protein
MNGHLFNAKLVGERLCLSHIQNIKIPLKKLEYSPFPLHYVIFLPGKVGEI